MRLWARIKRAVRRVFTPPPPAPPRDWTPRPRRTSPEPKSSSPLPAGWEFVALYHAKRPKGQRVVPAADPSDSDIQSADAIIVSYGTEHRTIHGATSRRDVGRLIQVVTIPDSPVK